MDAISTTRSAVCWAEGNSDLRSRPRSTERPILACGRLNSRSGFGGMASAERFVVGGTPMIQKQMDHMCGNSPVGSLMAWDVHRRVGNNRPAFAQ